ncbi:MAG: hypothetical protein LAO51_08790 [Acidobacteriia bacterium]|nr:hypothetical protein [Terriglobia bacterium]
MLLKPQECRALKGGDGFDLRGGLPDGHGQLAASSNQSFGGPSVQDHVVAPVGAAEHDQDRAAAFLGLADLSLDSIKERLGNIAESAGKIDRLGWEISDSRESFAPEGCRLHRKQQGVVIIAAVEVWSAAVTFA